MVVSPVWTKAEVAGSSVSPLWSLIILWVSQNIMFFAKISPSPLYIGHRFSVYTFYNWAVTCMDLLSECSHISNPTPYLYCTYGIRVRGQHCSKKPLNPFSDRFYDAYLSGLYSILYVFSATTCPTPIILSLLYLSTSIPLR